MKVGVFEGTSCSQSLFGDHGEEMRNVMFYLLCEGGWMANKVLVMNCLTI